MVKQYSFKKDGEKSLSPHFKVKEFKSKDLTDKILINTELISALETLYTKLRCTAINIVSGYRTPSHSVAVGGYSTDQHTKGNAADIYCRRGDIIIGAKKVCLALEDLDFNGGVGYISSTNIHIDVRGTRVWFDETTSDRVSSWYEYWNISEPIDENSEIDTQAPNVPEIQYFDEPKTYINTIGRPLYLFADSDREESIISMPVNTVCKCLGISKGCAVILYNNNEKYYIGFTTYMSGIKE